jgi:transcriptional regulator with XRE-family HTH domain
MRNAAEQRAFVAKRLREARELAGLSQGQVARILELHRPTISEIEAGRRRVSAEELARFSDIYRVSASWLLGEQDGDSDDIKVAIAARELSRLSPDDLDRLLTVIAAFRRKSGG